MSCGAAGNCSAGGYPELFGVANLIRGTDDAARGSGEPADISGGGGEAEGNDDPARGTGRTGPDRTGTERTDPDRTGPDQAGTDRTETGQTFGAGRPTGTDMSSQAPDGPLGEESGEPGAGPGAEPDPDPLHQPLLQKKAAEDEP